MLKKIVVLGLVASLMLLIVACGGGNSQSNNNQPAQQPSSPSAPEQPAEQLPSGFIDVRGSDTMVNLGQALAEYYMDAVNVNGNLAVTGGGSGTGIAGLLNNDLDIAQSSRAIREKELEDAAANGVDVYEFMMAMDGMAVAVNSGNPIKEMTKAQLKDIFTGKVTQWSELGWAEGGAISVFSRQSNSGTYVFFNENIMDGQDWADGTQFMPGSSAINEALQTDRNGIGYYGVGYVSGEANALLIEGISPFDAAAVGDGSYPIARPLYFYTNGVPEGITLHYLQWVLSDEAAEVIAGTGFYPLTKGANYDKLNRETFQKLGIEVKF